VRRRTPLRPIRTRRVSLTEFAHAAHALHQTPPTGKVELKVEGKVETPPTNGPSVSDLEEATNVKALSDLVEEATKVKARLQAKEGRAWCAPLPPPPLQLPVETGCSLPPSSTPHEPWSRRAR
jgi:hypothetical protein